MTGRELFARYAFPPNELGYCGPADTTQAELASHAKEFDGAWPYLQAIADAAGIADPLDDDVVHNYWVGGPLLDKVDPDELLTRLRSAFTGQVTGMLDDMMPGNALAHHSFHVFVVYPWVRFLHREPATPVRVMQACRIRWGTVESVDDEHVVISSPPADVRRRNSRARRRPPGAGAVAQGQHVAGTCTEAGRSRRRALGLGMRDPHGVRARRAGRCDRSGVGPGQPGSRFGWSIPGSPCSHEQPTGPVRRR